MNPGDDPGAGVGSSAAGLGHNYDTTSITDRPGALKPKLKWHRVLDALVRRPSLHRFTAERDPEVRDHCLPTTISELQKRGLVIERKIIEVPGYQGGVAHIAEYSLAPADREAARRLLASS